MKATPDASGANTPPTTQTTMKGAARMSVRAVAKAAYDASQTDRVAAARQAMIDLLGDPNGEFSAMPEAEVHAPPETDGYTLVIFADDDSDVRLGVQQAVDSTDWAVWLVTQDSSGDWTMQGEQAKSLEHLYLLIQQFLPHAWATGIAYKVGDKVTYNGADYVCLQAHTSQATWEPPNAPSLWSKVAAG